MIIENKKILLVITGGVAAFKAIDVMRLLKKAGADVTCVLTKSAKEFVTPLSLASLSGNKIYDELFDLNDEAEMGHIELSRASDLVLVVPATANFLAKMAQGLADDLASTLMLATDKDVMVAPAMNVRMWEHAAVQQNVATLKDRGILMVEPVEGEMACGEFGYGRLAEPEDIVSAVYDYFDDTKQIFANQHILITAGPTHEKIDPVRFIGNISSGKQGYAIAAWAQKMGAKVTLISGPTKLATPLGVERINITSARDMLKAVEETLPVDIAIFAAAVADWRVAEYQDQKIKKQEGEDGASIRFVENPDILKTISNLKEKRPNFVTGFAAETNNVIEHGIAKLKRKNCDMLVINDVSAATGVMGGDHNQVTIIEKDKDEQISLDHASKDDIAKGILEVIGEKINAKN